MLASSCVSRQLVRRCNAGVDVLVAEEPETRRVAVLHVLLSFLTFKGLFLTFQNTVSSSVFSTEHTLKN